MSEHIVRSFGDELAQLAAEVTRMGGLAEAQVAKAVESLVRRDLELAQTVVATDVRLDEMEADLERHAIRLIALRQPMAMDLRRGLAAMKIAGNLERVGDLAKSIAKRTLILAESEPITPLSRSMERMGRLVNSRLKSVIDAYAAGDVQPAIQVWSQDDDVDEHYNSLFRELLTYMMSDPRTITPCTHLLFAAKNLERIGDHATNIAEIIHYELTGTSLDEPRPKVDLAPSHEG